MQTKGLKRKRLPLYALVVIGTVVSFLVLLGGCAIGAICIGNEYLDLSASGVLGFITVLVSAMAGTLLSVILATDRKLLCVIGVCGAYYILLICAAFLIFDGVGQGALTNLIACLIAGICAIFLNFLKENPGKRRKGRKAIR